MQDDDDKTVDAEIQGGETPSTEQQESAQDAALPRPLPEHVNAPLTAEGNTYLHELCRKKATPALLKDAIKVLGAVADLPNNAGLPPLAYAITDGDAEMVSCLRNLGANIVAGEFNAVLYAVDANKRDALEVLLRNGRGYGVNTTGLLNNREKGVDTPLITALSIQRDDMIDLLLDAGALTDVCRKKDGAAALHLAAVRAGGEHVAQLLAAGADPLQTNNDGLTPLHVAASEGRVESMRLLLEYGVDINLRSAGGMTPLHVAVVNKRLDAVKFLLQAGADVDLRMEKEPHDTALQGACRRGYDEIALEILAAGADVLMQNSDKLTALALINKDMNRPFYEEIKKVEDESLRGHFERAHRRLMDEKRDNTRDPSAPKPPPYFGR